MRAGVVTVEKAADGVLIGMVRGALSGCAAILSERGFLRRAAGQALRLLEPTSFSSRIVASTKGPISG
ncbi:hypothetical protein X758_11975 [Mesorhizobium sp. LSHC416B00]|nr:hypothetical protein X761_12645 [Mesorhizobium sp. LSHC424B00]ESX73093.1 hypothetical protein X758_11975 [Mesorhizobium sp. LSHC416B00]